jgi:hypothetical protein
MKTRTLIMGALAMAIAGAGCSPDCVPVQSTAYDPWTQTGRVIGPAALGFPAIVQAVSVPANQPELPLQLYAIGGPDAGGSQYGVTVDIYGPEPPLGRPVTLPVAGVDGEPPVYTVSCGLIDLATWTGTTVPEELTISGGTLTSNQTFSDDGTVTRDLAVKISLVRSDGSLFYVDADHASQGHPYTYCQVPQIEN